MPDLKNTKIKSIVFGWISRYDTKLHSHFNHKIKNAIYLQKIYIKKDIYCINKYKNNIFDIMEINNAYKIDKNLNPFLKYMLYNNIYIPFEIYNYIYLNYNFTYNN